MFAQGGVDERQQVFVRGRELFNERRRRLSMGADDDEDYNESNNEDCVFPVSAVCSRAKSSAVPSFLLFLPQGNKPQGNNKPTE